ncbi:zinc-binding protein A33-like isoform X1 [Rhincodon typus]|uniref:zinc-binding protein A33-like isoform X1 n=1 Tax=Rhincodon typus TaxID=259920 RepID=UPI00202F307A|nr:zinc-binding protein A33-like isoform X1 [Rhincodon typus]
MAHSLNQDLRCTICTQMYTEPVTLDCGHNFCKECVLEQWNTGGAKVSCPHCGQCFPRRELMTNQLLATIVASLRNLNLEKEVGLGGQRCPLHGQQARLFCSKDLRLVCPSCPPQGHDGGSSTLIAVEEAYAICKHKLENSTRFLERKLEEFCEARVSQGIKITKTMELVKGLEENIEAEFSKLHLFLQEQECTLREELRKKSEELLHSLEGNLHLISKRSSSIEKFITEINCLIQTDDQDRLLMDTKSILQRTDLHNEPILQPSDLSLGEFKGPLQYAAWKRMLNVVSPVPAALAFDPDTANPSLVLSKDHTMVKRRSRFKQLPESAKRFTFCASVLGDEGFASGRHYWELDLENMSGWIVGAASETVNRNDDVPLTPANGFWTIRLWNGKVHTAAHGSSGSLCCSEGKPDRVGVYLDYDEGQLSFYNGSDMSHLYTFSDHFQEKLYPLALLLPNLETAEVEVLKIFHLYL